MTGSEHLRIVFRVAGVGFVMPVADLLAICESPAGLHRDPAAEPGSRRIGEFDFRGEAIPVQSLAGLFELSAPGQEDGASLLVFAGSDQPWAILVDEVAGVFGADRLLYRDLAAYLFDRTDLPYRQVALMDGEPLLSCDARQLDAAWKAS